MSVAEKLDTVAKPRNWDKAVSAAYLRLWGWSLKDSARGAGIGERTMERYVVSDWWPRACGEAVDRWFQQLEIECRVTIMQGVKAGDTATAVKMLERIDKRLAPPKQLHELAGYGGGPIENRHVHVYLPDNKRDPNDRFGNSRSPDGDRAPEPSSGSHSRNGR